MQLLVTLISGETQATIDASAEELVRQVEQRAAAAALERPLVRLLRAASTQPLAPALTVGEAGLLDGEELSGVALQQLHDIRNFIKVHFSEDEAEDLAAVRKALARDNGGCFVLQLPPLRANMDEAVWSELVDAQCQGLKLSVKGPELAASVTRNLRRLNSLRSAHLEFSAVPPGCVGEVLEALPEHLEELGLRVEEPETEELPACLLRLQNLRSLFLLCPASELVLQALPSGLESLWFCLSDEPRAVAAAVARMLALKGVHCWSDDGCSVETLTSLLCSLPPHLLNLLLSDLRLKVSSQDRLVGDFQNLSRLRVAALPSNWSDARLVLPVLPPSLAVLGLDCGPNFPSTEETVQPLLAGLRRLTALKDVRLAPPHGLPFPEAPDCHRVPDLVWSRLLAALPPTVERLHLGPCEGIQVAAAAELPRFAALRHMRCLARTCDAYLCLLEQLPESVENVCLRSPGQFQEVLRQQGSLTKTQLQQFLRAKFSPQSASEEDFKAQLSAAFEALQQREEAAGL